MQQKSVIFQGDKNAKKEKDEAVIFTIMDSSWLLKNQESSKLRNTARIEDFGA